MTDVASLGLDGLNGVSAKKRAKKSAAARRAHDEVVLKRPKEWVPSVNDEEDRADLVQALIKFRKIFDGLDGNDGGLHMQQQLRWNELANLLAKMGYIHHANDIISPESRFQENEPTWEPEPSTLPVRIEPTRHNISYIIPSKGVEEEGNLFNLLQPYIGQIIEHSPEKDYNQGLFGAFFQDLEQITTYKPDPRFPKDHVPSFIADPIPTYKPASKRQAAAAVKETPQTIEVPVASSDQLSAQQKISAELEQFHIWWDEQNKVNKGKKTASDNSNWIHSLKWPDFFYHFDHKGFAHELGAISNAPRFEAPENDADDTIRYLSSEKVPTFKKAAFNIQDADGQTRNLFDLLALYLQDTKDVRTTEMALANDEEKDFYARWEQYVEEIALAQPEEDMQLVPVVAPEHDERSYAPRHAKKVDPTSSPRPATTVPKISTSGRRTATAAAGYRVPNIDGVTSGDSLSGPEGWGRRGPRDDAATAKQPGRLKSIFATAGHVVTTGLATYLVTSTSRVALAGGLIALGAPAIPAAAIAGGVVGFGMVGYRYWRSGSKAQAGFGAAATVTGVALGAFGLESVSEPLARAAEAAMEYMPEPVRDQLIAMSTPVGQGIQKASAFVGLQFDEVKNRFFDWVADAFDASRVALKEQINNLLEIKQSQAIEIASLKQQLASASASLAGDNAQVSGDAITKRIVDAFTFEPNPDGSIPDSALPPGFGANDTVNISSFNGAADISPEDAVDAVNRMAALPASSDTVENLLPYAGNDTVVIEASPSDYTDYKVRKNDSLFKIGAREYGLRKGALLDWVKQTIELNPELAANPDALDRGQVLHLPKAHTDLPMADCNDRRLLKGYRNPCRVPSVS